MAVLVLDLLLAVIFPTLDLASLPRLMARFQLGLLLGVVYAGMFLSHALPSA